MVKLLVLKNLKGLVVVLLLCITAQVSANTLFNAGPGLPDIQSQDLNVNYTAASGDFNIVSDIPFTFGNYLDSGSNNNIFLGTFLLDFSVDAMGSLDNSGFFSIASTFGFGSGSTLLSGFVTDFGFSNTSFEVLLNITSGLLASEFGLDVGVIVSPVGGAGFTGFSLASNFTNGSAQSDTFRVQQVPEPSILALFAIAGLSFFRKGTRKQAG